MEILNQYTMHHFSALRADKLNESLFISIQHFFFCDLELLKSGGHLSKKILILFFHEHTQRNKANTIISQQLYKSGI